jgi:hypothetical protein
MRSYRSNGLLIGYLGTPIIPSRTWTIRTPSLSNAPQGTSGWDGTGNLFEVMWATFPIRSESGLCFT